MMISLKIKNIFVIPEFNEDLESLQKLYNHHLNISGINFYYYDWQRLIELKDDISYQQFLDDVDLYFQSLNLNPNETMVIGSGFGASIGAMLKNKYPWGWLVLTNPILAVNYVSPFVNQVPSYKSDWRSFFLRMKKEYHHWTHYFVSNDSPWFKTRYEHYTKHLDFYDAIIAKTSYYDVLLDIKKAFKKVDWTAVTVIYSVYDPIVSLKPTIKFIKKHHISGVMFQQSSHHLVEEEPVKFFFEIKRLIKQFSN